MRPDDLAEGGAASFYGLVLVSAFLASLVPVIVTRAMQKRFSKGWVAMCTVAVAAGAQWSALHPDAVAWANATSYFDPYEILDVASNSNSSVVRKAYRALSKAHHPDKGGDPNKFRELASAYAALAGDATAKRNYRDHGHPDGPRPQFAGIALPRGNEGVVLTLYVLLLALAIVPVVMMVKATSKPATRMPKKATVLALRDALADKARRPRTTAQWLSLLGALLDDHEGLDAPDDADPAGTLRAVKALDKGGEGRRAADGDGRRARAAREPAAAGRRLDGGGEDEAGVGARAGNLARAALELSLGVGLDAAKGAAAALQHVVAGAPPDAAEPAAISSLSLAVFDDDEPLPDVRAGDVAVAALELKVPPGDYVVLLGNSNQNAVVAYKPVTVPKNPCDFQFQVKCPDRVGKYVLAASVHAVDRHVEASRTVPYKVERQED
ncbi:protein translocation regulator [Aureococcus anophagefferens]|uniref:Protein translocation regulator n=1 Tax=Aureococcus anophagefferens TaxID=44056 RepID=A0ABR1FN73_AURAN